MSQCSPDVCSGVGASLEASLPYMGISSGVGDGANLAATDKFGERNQQS